MKLANLHRWYSRQAEWTSALREYAFNKAGLKHNSMILEVGSGTGAVMETLPVDFIRFGIDIDFDSVRFASSKQCEIHYSISNGLHLPFPRKTFDLVYCHFLLLWVSDPQSIVAEMIRVAKTKSWIAVFAEPDYGISPNGLTDIHQVRNLQALALQQKGAHPFRGRNLFDLFKKAGLCDIESGQIEFNQTSKYKITASEIATIRDDLRGLMPKAELDSLLQNFSTKMKQNPVELSVPTFFAIGRVP